MHIIAVLIAVAAVIVLVASHFAVPRKWATVPLGLALVVIAWMVQAIVVTGHHVTLN